jgi:hypothetical protein
MGMMISMASFSPELFILARKGGKKRAMVRETHASVYEMPLPMFSSSDNLDA